MATSRPSAIGAIQDPAVRTSLLQLYSDVADIRGATDAAFLVAIKAALAGTFVAVPTAWTGFTFANSWVNFDATHPAQYRKVGDGVELRGLVKNGTPGATITTLPAGNRPNQADETFPVLSNGIFAYLSVTSAGVITSTGSNVYIYLDGIRFSTVA